MALNETLCQKNWRRTADVGEPCLTLFPFHLSSTVRCLPIVCSALGPAMLWLWGSQREGKHSSLGIVRAEEILLPHRAGKDQQ